MKEIKFNIQEYFKFNDNRVQNKKFKKYKISYIFFTIKVKLIKFIRVFRINVCICEKI